MTATILLLPTPHAVLCALFSLAKTCAHKNVCIFCTEKKYKSESVLSRWHESLLRRFPPHNPQTDWGKETFLVLTDVYVAIFAAA